MQPVHSVLRRLTCWWRVFVDIAVAVGLIALIGIIVSFAFDLPMIAQTIFSPFVSAGEWCFSTYRVQPEFFTAGLFGLVLITAGLAGWRRIATESRRKEQRMLGDHIEYIDYVDNVILRDPELTSLWLQDGPSELSHAERASNDPAS